MQTVQEIVSEAPGLYFIGLLFQAALCSATSYLAAKASASQDLAAVKKRG